MPLSLWAGASPVRRVRMGEGSTAPSFSRQVFGYAVSHTRRALASKTRDAAWALPLALLGFAIYYFRFGWPAMSHQFVDALYTTIAPIIIAVAGVFLWHLWLAPAALAYEAARAARPTVAPTVAQQQSPRPQQINWAIWKRLQRYRLTDFASILAKRDPLLNSATTEELAFSKLLLQDANERKLNLASRI